MIFARDDLRWNLRKHSRPAPDFIEIFISTFGNDRKGKRETLKSDWQGRIDRAI